MFPIQKKWLSTKSSVISSFALAFGLALSSNAALALEGQPVAPKTCFVSDADGPANVKLNAAMKAREQKILITGNRAYPKLDDRGKPLFEEGYALNIFTSNAAGSEGYNIESNAPAGQIGTMYCVRAQYSDVHLHNAYKGGVPEDLNNLGELGRTLTYADAKGLRVMMSARVENAFLVVQGAMQDSDKIGSLKAADSKGGVAPLATMRDVDYSSRAKQTLGIPE